MPRSQTFTIVAGFLILFFVYHFPEFFPAFWVMAVFKIGFLAVAFFLGRAQGLKGLQGYGLGLEHGWGAKLLLGLFLGLIFFSLSSALSVFSGYDTISLVETEHIVAGLPMILVMTVFPSVAEDILTRGYLFAHIKFPDKPVYWVLLSALIYVLNHIWRLDDGPAVLSYLFVFGIVLAYAVLVAKSLWLAFGIHWGANIAFETLYPLLQATAQAGDASTWVLAGCWTALLIFLLLVDRFKATGWRATKLATEENKIPIQQ